jgi:hypothetical protein
MAEKEKPLPGIVRVAARVIKKPETATKQDIKSMAARILDDQKNDPQQHRPVNKQKK